MATKTFFKKGDKVTIIATWNWVNYGWNRDTQSHGKVGFSQIYIRKAIVASCGTKQMTLVDELTGEMLGRNFFPRNHQGGEKWVINRVSDEVAMDLAKKLTAAIKAERLAHLENRKNFPAYDREHDLKWIAVVEADVPLEPEDYHALYARLGA